MNITKLVPFALSTLAVAASLGVVACDDVGTTEDLATEATVSQQTNEALYSKGLQKKICDAIVARQGLAASGSDCEGFSYTVTEIAKSSKFAYQSDGRAITMRMNVDVEDPATGATYDAKLVRKLTSSFELTFEAEVGKTALEGVHDHIDGVADAAGEYGDFDEEGASEHVAPIAFDALPAHIQDIAVKAAERQAEDNCHFYYDDEGTGPCPNGASVADELYTISLDGEVVGYVIHIWDSIDHPLWDGSGVYLYLDSQGTLVQDVSWTG